MTIMESFYAFHTFKKTNLGQDNKNKRHMKCISAGVEQV